MANRLVTWPMTLKGHGRDPDMFGPNISKTAGDTDLVTTEHLQEIALGAVAHELPLTYRNAQLLG